VPWKSRLAHLTTEDARKIFLKWVKIFAEERKKKKEEEAVGAGADETAAPERTGTPPVIDFHERLLGILKTLPPAGFERLCQRLLRESGFVQVVVTGRSGDGGIDGYGTLQINPLVSFKVLFQCKRFKALVSAPLIRDFRGAMQGRADKGIVMTTGVFTSDARKEAGRDGVPPIELIDGDKLIKMFVELELGLKPVTTYDIDEGFFKEFKE
jgi:restriction system protein